MYAVKLRTPASITFVLSGVAKLMSPRASEKGLGFIDSVSPDVPDRLVGDPGRLRQVLLSLVGNAIKFTNRELIEVQVLAVNEEANPEGCALHFSIRDSGVGMAREKLKDIFEAFTQADSSTTRLYGGTGLGLAISKRLVDMMRGRIWVDSQLGVGSTFQFSARFGLQP